MTGSFRDQFGNSVGVELDLRGVGRWEWKVALGGWRVELAELSNDCRVRRL